MQQCATASEDGTCIIWDLERYTRSQMVMANSLFQVLVLSKLEKKLEVDKIESQKCGKFLST